MELPDIYETRQGRAMAAALTRAMDTGDLIPAFKLADHIVAESGISRDDVLAAMLFRLSTMASMNGDDDAAEYFRLLSVEHCSQGANRRTVAAALLAVGIRTGSLPAVQYDRLVELLDSDSQALQLITDIQRVK